MAIGRSRALGAALLLLAGGARPASGAARSVMFARGRVAAPLVRRPGAPRGLALCAARGKTITENLDEVPRERLVEICNALRDRWGSVERIYDDMTVAGPPGSDNFQQIDMEAFMGAVEAAEVRCSRAEMAQVFKAVDLDNSGTLEMEELRLALRESGAILRTYQQSLTTMVASIGAAVLFGVGVGVVRGPSDAADFATAYIIEDSLSVDNLFVFVLLFEYFRVPLWLQQRCLTLGIAGARQGRGASCQRAAPACVDASSHARHPSPPRPLHVPPPRPSRPHSALRSARRDDPARPLHRRRSCLDRQVPRARRDLRRLPRLLLVQAARARRGRRRRR